MAMTRAGPTPGSTPKRTRPVSAGSCHDHGVVAARHTASHVGTKAGPHAHPTSEGSNVKTTRTRPQSTSAGVKRACTPTGHNGSGGGGGGGMKSTTRPSTATHSSNTPQATSARVLRTSNSSNTSVNRKPTASTKAPSKASAVAHASGPARSEPVKPHRRKETTHSPSSSRCQSEKDAASPEAEVSLSPSQGPGDEQEGGAAGRRDARPARRDDAKTLVLSDDSEEEAEVLKVLNEVRESLSSSLASSSIFSRPESWRGLEPGSGGAASAPSPRPVRASLAQQRRLRMRGAVARSIMASSAGGSLYSSANSEELREFEEFTREVAARVIQFYWCAARARRPKAAFPFAENKPPNHLPTLDRAPTPRALPLLADEEEDQEEGNTASHRQALPSLHAPDSQQGPVRRKLSAPVGDVGGEEEHCAQAGGLSAADGPRPRETSPQPTRQSCAASSETVTAAVESQAQDAGDAQAGEDAARRGLGASSEAETEKHVQGARRCSPPARAKARQVREAFVARSTKHAAREDAAAASTVATSQGEQAVPPPAGSSAPTKGNSTPPPENSRTLRRSEAEHADPRAPPRGLLNLEASLEAGLGASPPQGREAPRGGGAPTARTSSVPYIDAVPPVALVQTAGPAVEALCVSSNKVEGTTSGQEAEDIRKKRPVSAHTKLGASLSGSEGGEQRAGDEEGEMRIVPSSRTGRSHNSPPQLNRRSESGPAERIQTQGADKLSSFLQYLDEAENSHERADASLSLAPVQSGGSTPGLGVESHTYGVEAQRAGINQIAGMTAVPPLQQLLQAPTSVRRSDLREVVPAPGGGAWEGALGGHHAGPLLTDRSAASTANTAATAVSSFTEKSSALAHSVYDGVKTKMRELRAQLSAKDMQLEEAETRLERMREREARVLSEAEARLQAALEEQRAEAEKQQARHLGFIDRLLADKDALTQKCASLATEIASGESRAEVKKQDLTKHWSTELKKQKEAWEAAEKIRREQWMAEKTREVKELTIRGLEPEIQRLVAKQKAEVRRIETRQQEELRRQHDELSSQNEQYNRQLRERLMKEREDAVEKERLNGQARLREQAERYESQANTQRVRMGTDSELAVERLEAMRREDKARHEEHISRIKREEESRQDDMRKQLTQAAEDAERKHASEVKAMKEKFEVEQETWRAHVLDKARKELVEKEKVLKAKCEGERDAQLELVVNNLQSEADASRTQMQRKHKEELEQIQQKHAREIEGLGERNSKLDAAQREAVESRREMAGRLASAEKHVDHLRQELTSKNETLQWMEKVMSSTKSDLATREQEIRSVYSEKEEVHKHKLQALQEEKQNIQRRLDEMDSDYERIRQRKDAEIEQLESRVRQTLAKKDETIAQLRDQLGSVTQQLRYTEQVLQRQQDDILRTSDA